MDLDEIIRKALPSVNCAIENQYIIHRRQQLKKRLNEYIAEELSKLFNAKAIDNGDKPGIPGNERSMHVVPN